MSELSALLQVSHSWPVEPVLCIGTLDLKNAPAAAKHYAIGECDRNHLNRVFGVLIRSLKIVVKERPTLVVTTGSMPLAIFGLVAKLFGSKLIWIDSISQIDDISMSGKLVVKFADLFFVQWPQIEKSYPNVLYRGELV